MLLTDDPVACAPNGAGPRFAPCTAVRVPRALVVEPDPGLRAALARHLEGAGFAVRTAADGLEALFALDSAYPDLVLLELLLPQVSGFRLLHLLKRPSRGTPPPLTLVLTALSFEEAGDAVRERPDGFVTKPLAPHDLRALAGRARCLIDRRRWGVRADAPAGSPALALAAAA